MIVVKSFDRHDNTKTVEVELFADSKSEITDDIAIDGMPTGYSIEVGSVAQTSDGDFAYRKSNNTWNWI